MAVSRWRLIARTLCCILVAGSGFLLRLGAETGSLAVSPQPAYNFDSIPLIGPLDAESVHVLAPGEYAWFHDPDGRVDLVKAGEFFAGSKDKSDPWGGKYGYLEGTVWIAFRIALPPGFDELVFTETYGVDHARFFVHDHGRHEAGYAGPWSWLQAESGWSEKASLRALPLRQSNVGFSLGSSTVPRQVICFVALESNTSIALGIEFGTDKAFLVRQQPILGLAGGFAAAMVFLVILCTIFALRYRQGLFINLAVYMVIAALMVMYNLGFANWLFWPDFPLLGRICATWCWGVACMLNVVFILGHLDLRNRSKPAYAAGLVYLGIWALLSLLFLNFDERTAYRLSSWFSLSFPLFYLFFVYMAFRLKNPHAWLLVLFWVFLTGGIMVVFLRNLGVIPEGSHVYFIIFASVAGQCLCFLLPLYLESRKGNTAGGGPGRGMQDVLGPGGEPSPHGVDDRLFRD